MSRSTSGRQQVHARQSNGTCLLVLKPTSMSATHCPSTGCQQLHAQAACAKQTNNTDMMQQPHPPQSLLQVGHPLLQHLAAAGCRRLGLPLQLGLCMGRAGTCGHVVGKKDQALRGNGWNIGQSCAACSLPPAQLERQCKAALRHWFTCRLQPLRQPVHFMLQSKAPLLRCLQARAALLHGTLRRRSGSSSMCHVQGGQLCAQRLGHLQPRSNITASRSTVPLPHLHARHGS